MSDLLDPRIYISALSNAIKNRRKNLNISQEDLSYESGFARGYISDLERGARNFSIKNLVRLANCLGVKPSVLMQIAERTYDQTAKKRRDKADILIDINYDLDSLNANSGLDLAEIFEWITAPARAVLLTDATKRDNPVVYVSPGFTDFTGYALQEVQGKNCRFLQGFESQQPGILKLRESIEAEQSCSVILQNFKKNGYPFTNTLSVSPIHRSNKKLIGFVGLQAFSE